MTMAVQSAFPRLNKVSFYRSKDEELVHLAADAVSRAMQERQFTPTRFHIAVYAWSAVLTNVPNGGFVQFFFNLRGDSGLDTVRKVLDRLGQHEAEQLIGEAASLYQQQKPAFQKNGIWDGLYDSVEGFDQLDTRFSVVEAAVPAMAQWMREQIPEFFVAEDGTALDPHFNGVVERRGDGDAIVERLEVKNGRAHGVYRAFFEDGSVSQFGAYEAGESLGEYWPSGHLNERDNSRWEEANRVVLPDWSIAQENGSW
jgi:Domain of unknown function (DUF4375)